MSNALSVLEQNKAHLGNCHLHVTLSTAKPDIAKVDILQRCIFHLFPVVLMYIDTIRATLGHRIQDYLPDPKTCSLKNKDLSRVNNGKQFLGNISLLERNGRKEKSLYQWAR